MRVLFLNKIKGVKWFEKLPKSKEFPRHYITLIDLEIQLSDGYILKIDNGFIWDGASVPSWLHWLFPPIDEGALADLIHDKLWTDKQKQFEYFGYNIYKARKFADDERLLWRKALAPKRKIFNWISHKVIRLLGGLFYSKQIKIPK
ncbi:DUF1353 domain-containing protein [Riemerella anatipestifer]|uniref:DUF1353 domain-containing protein n=2 Tax=Riemerella anatipestifer TaxID=34085 RepID=UPI001372DFB7|nr:DUF1353 domain-containing protein [Riemerella anatipestifer]MBT0549164.1 DUF1353 domain-containing protein [Riemerella anatipestifer]MBT0556161.1 DUF1353 domain-containing protein [Riemerella anatipestifer]MBT0559927.1 DUF1353 domain-containing protein [Riemerella anatipestifer]MDD1538632.1 DUF1353 domain-containing protein [Riemerella anatipestifer]NAV16293.1 DUF1353 domain-containing protein [Riemerella anatipestifer]